MKTLLQHIKESLNESDEDPSYMNHPGNFINRVNDTSEGDQYKTGGYDIKIPVAHLPKLGLKLPDVKDFIKKHGESNSAYPDYHPYIEDGHVHAVLN